MSKTRGAPDAFTVAIAAALLDRVRDRHREFPRLQDFKDAVRAATGLSADTVERVIHGRTSIRVDYLSQMAVLLGTSASEIVRIAEDQMAASSSRTESARPADAALPSDVRSQLDILVKRVQGELDTDEPGAGQTTRLSPGA